MAFVSSSNSYLTSKLKLESTDQWLMSVRVLCDCCLATDDGGEFPIHRIILCNGSDYFRALFCHNPEKTRFVMRGLQKEVVEQVLRYIYTKEVCVTENNICSLLVASDYFLMGDLLSTCLWYIRNQMSPVNCVLLYVISLQLEHLRLTRLCYRFIQIHFEEVVMGHGNIRTLPFDTLVELLEKDTLNVSSEETVWYAILKWVDDDETYRADLFHDLIRCLRPHSLTSKFICDAILAHPLVRKNKLCSREMDTEVIAEDNTNPVEVLYKLTGRQPTNLRTRQPCKIHYFIDVTFADYNCLDKCEIYEFYDDELDFWRKVGHKEEFSPDNVLTIKDALYFFDTWQNTFTAFNVIERTWSELPPTQLLRFEYNVAVADGRLFILGGTDELFVLRKEVEIYDPETRQWSTGMPMTRTYSGQAQELNGQIYVLGDHLDKELNSYVLCGECYDPKSNSWTILPHPGNYRRDFALAAYQDCLYMIGGRNKEGELTMVQKYCPGTATWSLLPDLPYAMHIPKAMVFKGTLVVYEGHSETSQFYSKKNPPVWWRNGDKKWDIVDPTSILNMSHKYLHACMDDGPTIAKIREYNKNEQWVRTAMD